MTTVVNVRMTKEFDVYIGRSTRRGRWTLEGSCWANPFIIGRDGTRQDVIMKYRTMVEANPEMQRAIRARLRGKVLGCFCAPKPCHGDVLAEIANA